MSVDVGDGLAEVSVGLDRQDWTEDFLLKHLHFVRRVKHQRRRDFAYFAITKVFSGRVELDQPRALATRVGEIAVQAVEVAAIDDRGEIRIVLEGRIHLADATSGLGDECIQRLLG